jgi:hypothetical protein
MNFLTAVLTLFALLFSSHGFGFATMKWIIRGDTNYFSWLVVVGITCLIFIGGLLNFIGIAYPEAMYSLLFIGVGFSILSYSRQLKTRPLLTNPLLTNYSAKKVSRLNCLLPLFCISAAIVFFAWTLLPSDAFNFFDDFHTYMTRPVRMLQTGTLAGDPYELLGIDSLGAQAFLQGFLLLNLPVEYLPGIDAVFGMGISGLLLIVIAQKFSLSWVYATAAVLIFLAINPQSVNVSALYSGTSMILGLLFSSCLLVEKLNESELVKPLGMAALAGLFISSLVALKSTLVFFAVIYCIFFCLGLFAIMQNKRHAALISTAIGIFSAATILPWMLLHLPHYMAALNARTHSVTDTNASAFALPNGSVSEIFSIRELLSGHNLYYGGSLLVYVTLLLMFVVIGILAALVMLRSNNVKRKGYSLVIISSSVAAIGTYFVNGLLFDPEAAVRYICPVLIATVPFCFLAFLNAATKYIPQQSSPNTLKAVILIGVTLVVVMFGNNFIDRITLAYNKHTTLAFPFDDGYAQYNSHVLSEKTRQEIREIQYLTVPGTKIFTWTSTPLHLDFARNEIQVVMEAGLINPWLEVPFGGDSESMVRYLKKQGVRYILWEYSGAGVIYQGQKEYKNILHSPFLAFRRIAERTIYLRSMMISIMRTGAFIYNKDNMVLFDLDQIN